MKQKLNLVNKDDLDIHDIRGSGKGGQARNKNSTGVRIVHRASGAVGEATDSRHHETNKRAAFRRMYESNEFQVWMDLELHPERVLIEKYQNGSWIRM